MKADNVLKPSFSVRIRQKRIRSCRVYRESDILRYQPEVVKNQDAALISLPRKVYCNIYKRLFHHIFINTEKIVANATRSGVFLTKFEEFDNVVTLPSVISLLDCDTL